jgi:guanylate kinase
VSAERPGIPFVLAAPSGTGKTTVCLALRESDPRLVFSVSHTTRQQRSGEKNGEHYHFVTDVEFRRLVDADAFLEWAFYNGKRYGTSWKSIEAPLSEGRDVLLEIEVQGARQVRKRLPEAKLIFLLPPSKQKLEERLRGRGTDSPEEVAKRLRTAQEELEAVEEFDYAVFNDHLEDCVADLKRIIAAERAGDATGVRRRFAPGAAAAKLRAKPA